MRYLVFGDVHANLLALDAVLAAGKERGVEAYLFVGDLVGYGPNPLECIERLKPWADNGSFAWVAGNHELALRGDVETTAYSPEAIQTLTWTWKQIEDKPWAKEFIESPYLTTCVNDTIWLTHDSLANPSSGGYHRHARNAKSELASLRHNRGRVCFYGHTHTIRAEISEIEKPVVLVPMVAHEGEGRDPKPVKLKPEELGWIGTGSTGFPTNPKRQPEYLILDEQDGNEWLIEKYEVDYPRKDAKERVKQILGPVCDKGIADRIAGWL
ncbi:MAG TPA: metallophosphoesterase family protein [Verrucomicrobiae bacterium]|nr:metallophosphoesterase family protein [Verrucomicrobiae bacterium]